MDYPTFFRAELCALRDSGNYREFAELERHRGAFPKATCHSGTGNVTIWCSNDYLGMGQHQDGSGSVVGLPRSAAYLEGAQYSSHLRFRVA